MTHVELLNWCALQMCVKMFAGEIPPFCYYELTDVRL